ncbi:glycine cleavage system protein GcvH [Paenibacillus sp. P96]|uniref:Glycine cleavage system H protein n=1 Tax=Paenibacillus zeirhizosphaerae TaxID=2987519 RepID=A0ABT9FKK4_9BACL|nr:glycine cleavage system protein GcvH [Paenibacillus sp. P96]MDP4095256.1 glycine cleavage system protein GcvH [Paenibacillus sp. P96]
MSEVKENYLYSEEHEWVKITEEGTLLVGISDFAQHQLGDIVFVELPEQGAALELGASVGTIESVKTVSDLYAPVSGTVIKVNESLQDSPELVNSSPYEEGWMFEIQIDGDVNDAVSKLLSAEAYSRLVEEA